MRRRLILITLLPLLVLPLLSTPAGAVTVHDDSITSFSPTLPDDVQHPLDSPRALASNASNALSPDFAGSNLAGGTEIGDSYYVDSAYNYLMAAPGGYTGSWMGLEYNFTLGSNYPENVIFYWFDNASFHVDNVTIDVYHSVSSSWVTLDTLAESATLTTSSVTLSPEDYDSDILRVRLVARGSDEFATADVFVDHILVETRNPVGIRYAEGGSALYSTGGTYASTHVSDDTFWYLEATITGMELSPVFQLDFTASRFNELDIEYWFNRTSGTGTFDSGGVQMYNVTAAAWQYVYSDTDWQASEVSRSISLSNGHDFVDLSGEVHVRALLTTTDGGGSTEFGVYIDYCSLVLNATAETGYFESFAEVNDYNVALDEATESISTDGDICTINAEGDSANDADYFYTTAPSLAVTAKYIQIRYRMENLLADDWRFYIADFDYAGAGGLGTNHYWWYLTETTSWATLRFYMGSDGTVSGTKPTICETLLIRSQLDSGVDCELYLDYEFISAPVLIGYQHDGSTTEGWSSSDGGSITSDGDKLTLTADGDGSSFDLIFDNTSTPAALSCTYYPFLEVGITSGTWGLQQYDGAAYATLETLGVHASGIYRYNTRSQDTTVTKFTLTLSASVGLNINYIKAYSIANFTLTQGLCEVDDYLYVSDGVLYCSGLTSDTNEYIRLDHDPTVSVSSQRSYLLVTDMNDGVSEFYVTFYAGSWGTAMDDITGSMGTATVTDIRLQFQGKTTAASLRYISALYFLSDTWGVVGTASFEFWTPDWNVVNIISFALLVPIELEGALNAFSMLLGLVLIPTSTVYLVRGGREDMSTRKLYLALICFFMGWALFLGGLLG